jgi:hypothetical protein
MQPPTSLARPIDFSYPSNRWAVGALLVVLVALGARAILSGGTNLLEIALEAVGGAFWTFSTWALAREFDPDEPRTAMISSGLIGAFLIVIGWMGRLGSPRALEGMVVMGSLMILTRVLVRSTGIQTRWTDVITVGLGGLIGALIASSSVWFLGLLFGAGLLWDANRDGDTRRGLVGAGLGAIGAVLGAWLGRERSVGLEPGWVETAAWVVVAVGIALAAFGARQPSKSVSDNGSPLDQSRVLATRVAGIVGTIAAALLISPVVALGAAFVLIFFRALAPRAVMQTS